MNNLQHKQLVKITKIIAFIIDHGGMKIHYNGTTTNSIVYSVPKLKGHHPLMEHSKKIRVAWY